MSTNAPATEKRSERLPDAQIHELLSAERRALALSILHTDGPLSLRELADAIARHEFGPGFDSAERKRVYVALYQHHLPKLDNYGVIDRDGNREIRLTERANPVLWHLNNGYDRGGSGTLSTLARHFF